MARPPWNFRSSASWTVALFCALGCGAVKSEAASTADASSEDAASGGGASNNGGTSSNGGSSSGGAPSGGGACPCGGCGGADVCCDDAGKEHPGSACDHSCPPGTTVSPQHMYCIAPGECEKNEDCASDELCEYKNPFSPCSGEGNCVERPSGCPAEDAGGVVCACNGVSMSSDCAARAAGWDVKHPGGC